MGIFDGVHLGHQAVLNSAYSVASAKGGLVAVLTFTPHPSRVLRPEQATRLLYDCETKEKRLYQSGVDAVIWKDFDLAFANMGAESFIESLPTAFPSLASLHVGENFRFGLNRAGTPDLLCKLLEPQGITVEAVPQLEWESETVSSTRLRQALSEGRIEEVNTMLGAPYMASAKITPGRKLGRTLGFSTFNLPYDPELRPQLGVYVVNVVGPNGERFPAVANYGLRPTVEHGEGTAPLLEVHLLSEGVPQWSAGERLTVEWMSFLRPEMRFSGLGELKAQIGQDVVAARAWFSR
jgi:riboflavin kinase/FMN adenylyltransferase